jgi:hypothetical protein
LPPPYQSGSRAGNQRFRSRVESIAKIGYTTEEIIFGRSNDGKKEKAVHSGGDLPDRRNLQPGG